MEAVYIVGVGMTPFGKRLERSVKDLTREAVTAALGDAGCARSDLEAAYFSNACGTSHTSSATLPTRCRNGPAPPRSGESTALKKSVWSFCGMARAAAPVGIGLPSGVFAGR